MNKIRIIAFTIPAIILLLYLYYLPPSLGDWEGAFYPAIRAWLSGQNPYGNLGTGLGFYNPPWLLPLLAPLSLLSIQWSGLIIRLLGVAAYIFILHHIKATTLLIPLFLLSIPVLIDLHYGNITWLVLLGYIMPPPIGLFFVLLKPQIGGAVAIFWAIQSWRQGGMSQLIRTCTPIVIGLLISVIFFGSWWSTNQNVIDVTANISAFPRSIPIGLILLAFSLYKNDIRLAYMVSPFLSPYYCLNAGATILLGCAKFSISDLQRWARYLAQLRHKYIHNTANNPL